MTWESKHKRDISLNKFNLNKSKSLLGKIGSSLAKVGKEVAKIAKERIFQIGILAALSSAVSAFFLIKKADY